MMHRPSRFMAGLTGGQLNPLRRAISYTCDFIVSRFVGSTSRPASPVRCGWSDIDPTDCVPHTVRLVPEIKRGTAQITRIDRDDAGEAA